MWWKNGCAKFGRVFLVADQKAKKPKSHQKPLAKEHCVNRNAVVKIGYKKKKIVNKFRLSINIWFLLARKFRVAVSISENRLCLARLPSKGG